MHVFVFFALLSGKVTHEAMPLLGCWLLGGFVVQFVVALLDLKGGKTILVETRFYFFSAFFMLVGGLEMIMKFNMINAGITFDARIDGWAWMVLTLATLLWTPAFFLKALDCLL